VLEWPTLLIFDVDGTLVPSFKEDLLPARAPFFARLPAEVGVALASNQGGVGLRYWMEAEGWGNPSGLPTPEQAETRLRHIAEQILALRQRELRIYAAFSYCSRDGRWGPLPPYSWQDPRWNRDWRKPEPGMILQALRDFGCPAEEALMIGDRPEDEAAAAAAGIRYEDAAEFFGREAILCLERIWGEIAAEGPDGWDPAWQCGPNPAPARRALEIVARIQAILAGEGG